MSIRIVKENNPAGDYWLEYDSNDEETVNHILAGMSWKPTADGAKRFDKIARIHGIGVEWRQTHTPR